jgi:DNA repair photolyase
MLYHNLPEKLREELDNPKRRSSIQWVAFNTASDSFQTYPTVLDTTYRAMNTVLERGIGFSFLTKGWIPNRFIALFAEWPQLIKARIGLVSTSQRYRELFEPYAATVAARLENIDRLEGAGIEAEVRIDPIIPFYTDDEVSIRTLYEALVERGIQTVTLSYLHLRPAILYQLQRELPRTEFNVIRSCFKTQPWTVVGTSSRTKLIPSPLREKGYERFIRLAEEFGISASICACKNPDIPAHRCTTGIAINNVWSAPREVGKQLTLFPC